MKMKDFKWKDNEIVKKRDKNTEPKDLGVVNKKKGGKS
jgi:hypothetical protein